MITVVDYGIGNIGALVNMLEHLGVSAESSSDSASVSQAQQLILPGVGAFDRAMHALRDRHLVAALNEAVLGRAVPVLGICLGMQLMARRSEEGSESGLCWMAADVRRLKVRGASDLRVPNVGWRTVRTRGASVLLDGSPPQRFYFTHSYHVICDNDRDVVATIDHDGEVICAVQSGNIFGVQFHPEKSHRFGLDLLGRFASLSGQNPP